MTRPSLEIFPPWSPRCCASGLRLGEACAVFWRSIDFDGRHARGGGDGSPVKGKGLLRQDARRQRRAVEALRLPRWCVQMLRERAARLGGRATFPYFRRSRARSGIRRTLRPICGTPSRRRDSGGLPATCSARRRPACSMQEAWAPGRSPTSSVTPGRRSPWTGTWAAGCTPRTAPQPSSKPSRRVGALSRSSRWRSSRSASSPRAAVCRSGGCAAVIQAPAGSSRSLTVGAEVVAHRVGWTRGVAGCTLRPGSAAGFGQLACLAHPNCDPRSHGLDAAGHT